MCAALERIPHRFGLVGYINTAIRAPESGGFDQQTKQFLLLEQHIQPDLHRQSVDATQTPAGDLFLHGSAVGP